MMNGLIVIWIIKVFGDLKFRSNYLAAIPKLYFPADFADLR